MTTESDDVRVVDQAVDIQQAVDDYDDVDEEAKVGREIAPADTALTDDEQAVIKPLEDLGFKLEAITPISLVFERIKAKHEDDIYMSTRRLLPRASISALGGQLGEAVTDHPSLAGLIIPARGYVEIRLQARRPYLATMTADRLFRLNYDTTQCPHTDLDKQLASLPFIMPMRRGEEGEQTKRIHLPSSTPNGPCLEISNASPLAMLFYGRAFDRDRTPFMATMKVDYGAAMTERSLILGSEELARSFLYELDVRNGFVIGTEARTLRREARRLARGVGSLATNVKVRYPRTRIQHEVSNLFNFASQARDNPPLAFLSYYQALEYFIPAAVRQSALKSIRRELRDPTFDEASDNCLLRIVAATEGSMAIGESHQFRTLVREYVRPNRLEEFFAQDWGNYFTRQGPILAVENINVKNPAKELTDQVADRIYQIRNRIVHAKDDPRYGGARVLLPQSQEAEALTPDVQLVRLLASEAISANQGPAT